MLNREGTDEFDAMKSPSVVFLGIDASKVKNAMTSPSLQVTIISSSSGGSSNKVVLIQLLSLDHIGV